jgi:hypothetical protein
MHLCRTASMPIRHVSSLFHVYASSSMHAFSMYFLVRMHSLRIPAHPLCHTAFSAMQLPVAHTYDRHLIERDGRRLTTSRHEAIRISTCRMDMDRLEARLATCSLLEIALLLLNCMFMLRIFYIVMCNMVRMTKVQVARPNFEYSYRGS